MVSKLEFKISNLDIWGERWKLILIAYLNGIFTKYEVRNIESLAMICVFRCYLEIKFVVVEVSFTKWDPNSTTRVLLSSCKSYDHKFLYLFVLNIKIDCSSCRFITCKYRWCMDRDTGNCVNKTTNHWLHLHSRWMTCCKLLII